ncbi:MAG TPA: PLP-dependent cysteine synthase family protein [Balneolales bacterium]|nr:PLP-dependent cysteine synthase family protein [Balneolales bacterium]
MPVTTSVHNHLDTRIADLQQHIGHTPLFSLNSLSPNEKVKIYSKIEWQQFGGSVKARAAFNIIKEAVSSGLLTPGKRLLDATSGNTGIAYAHIGANLNIPVTLFMPENASEERKMLLKSLGVDLRFTSRFGSTDEAQEAAQDLYSSDPDTYYYADQYSNDNNWRAHYKTTANEIIDQTHGSITHFISGLGTTGTFTGTGRRLKEFNSDIQLMALQPETALHGLEGWKHLETAMIPDIYDRTVADQLRTVDTGTAYDTIKLAAKKTGLLLSPSSAANLAGALKLAEEMEEGVIVTVFPDNADKYGEVLQQLFR